jgi:hypothetical protein
MALTSAEFYIKLQSWHFLVTEFDVCKMELIANIELTMKYSLLHYTV